MPPKFHCPYTTTGHQCTVEQICCYYCPDAKTCLKGWPDNIITCKRYNTERWCRTVLKFVTSHGYYDYIPKPRINPKSKIIGEYEIDQ